MQRARTLSENSSVYSGTTISIRYACIIIPKAEGGVRFIADYHRINQKLVRELHPLPRLGETMQQLEDFQYETSLYLNMGYYTIRILPASQDMMTIVTEFGKLSGDAVMILNYQFETKSGRR